MADHLSRWDMSEHHQQHFYDLTKEIQLTECVGLRKSLQIYTQLIFFISEVHMRSLRQELKRCK